MFLDFIFNLTRLNEAWLPLFRGVLGAGVILGDMLGTMCRDLGFWSCAARAYWCVRVVFLL